jgi:hypothetical protein
MSELPLRGRVEESETDMTRHDTHTVKMDGMDMNNLELVF